MAYSIQVSQTVVTEREAAQNLIKATTTTRSQLYTFILDLLSFLNYNSRGIFTIGIGAPFLPR